jgi:hypothetical protein
VADILPLAIVGAVVTILYGIPAIVPMLGLAMGADVGFATPIAWAVSMLALVAIAVRRMEASSSDRRPGHGPASRCPPPSRSVRGALRASEGFPRVAYSSQRRYRRSRSGR